MTYPLLCRIFGHRARIIPTYRGIAGQQKCVRRGCAWRQRSIRWSKPTTKSAVDRKLVMVREGQP